MNFTNLPTDIILNIIRMDQESFTEIRLISPRWNGVALQHLTYRNQLPSIHSFCYNMQYSRFDTVVDLKLHMSKRYLRFFGVHRWRVNASDQDDIFVESKVVNEASRKYLLRPLKRCSRIETLTISTERIVYPNEEINVFKQILTGVKIDHLLLIRFGTNADSQVLNFLRANKVLRLTVYNSHLGSYSFVSAATALVPTIEIKFDGSDRLSAGYLPSPLTLFESLQCNLSASQALSATSFESTSSCITIKSKEIKDKNSD